MISKFRKYWVISKWLVFFIVTGIIGYSSFIMFFPAWFTRKIPVVKWLFWIWLDDSRYDGATVFGYSKDYWYDLNSKGKTREDIWTAYSWHTRNKMWNLDSLLRPRGGERKIVENVIDELIMNFKRVDQSWSWIPMARLKFWQDGVDGDQVNQGQYISRKHSILGKGFVWEKIGNRLTFRYSECQIRPYFFFWNRWRVIQFGENDKRRVFNIKYYKIKRWK